MPGVKSPVPDVRLPEIELIPGADPAASVETIGRLYGGNWMLIPWDAVAATSHDIYAKASTEEPMTIEFIAIIE